MKRQISVCLIVATALPILVLAEETFFPCGVVMSGNKLAGPHRTAEPGVCKTQVGNSSTPCKEDGEEVCSSATDYWGRDDDECLDFSTDPDSKCSTTNYTGSSSRWNFRCPDQSSAEDGCLCIRVTNDLDTQLLSYMSLEGDTVLCFD
jgi:hypothetical protein